MGWGEGPEGNQIRPPAKCLPMQNSNPSRLSKQRERCHPPTGREGRLMPEKREEFCLKKETHTAQARVPRIPEMPGQFAVL